MVTISNRFILRWIAYWHDVILIFILNADTKTDFSQDNEFMLFKLLQLLINIIYLDELYVLYVMFLIILIWHKNHNTKNDSQD